MCPGGYRDGGCSGKRSHSVLWEYRGGGDSYQESFGEMAFELILKHQWVWPLRQKGKEWAKSKELSLKLRTLFRTCTEWERQVCREKSYKDPKSLLAQGQPCQDEGAWTLFTGVEAFTLGSVVPYVSGSLQICESNLFFSFLKNTLNN